MSNTEYTKDILIWLGLFIIWLIIGLALAPLFGYPNPPEFPKRRKK